MCKFVKILKLDDTINDRIWENRVATPGKKNHN